MICDCFSSLFVSAARQGTVNTIHIPRNTNIPAHSTVDFILLLFIFFPLFVRFFKCPGHLIQIFLQGADQFLYDNWFGQEPIHTTFQCFLSILIKGIGSHSKNSNSSQCRIFFFIRILLLSFLCIFLFYNIKISNDPNVSILLQRRPQCMQFQFVHLAVIFHPCFYLHRDFFILYRCLI